MTHRLPAEWETQDAVLLAWPHPHSDWWPDIDRVEPAFAAMARAVSRFQTALVLVPSVEWGRERLALHGLVPSDRLRLVPVATNDTWARDFGPTGLVVDRLAGDGARARLVDFVFNGWGGKFEATLDNGATRAAGALGLWSAEVSTTDWVLEGGSIDANGRGDLLTTTACLLAPGRNEGATRAELDQMLRERLFVDRVHWLQHGRLEGDDTDGHVDTLARFVDESTIAYVRCDDAGDTHFDSFQAMEAELRELRGANGAPFRLVPLPWPRARFDATGRRLPASYANFLVINGAVLVPTYDDPSDARAVQVVGSLFPGREAISIDCSAIIEQSGAVHCLTMQLPRGVVDQDWA